MNPFWEPTADLSLRRRSDDWVHAGVAETSSSSSYLGRPLGVKQIAAVALLTTFIMVALVGRAFQLQVVEGAYHRGLAEGNRLRTKTLLAPRGLLYDQYGRVLTQNTPRMALALVPYDVPREAVSRATLFSEVSEASGVTSEVFEQAWEAIPERRREGFEPVLIDVPLTPEQSLRAQLARGRWRGVTVLTIPERRVASANGESESLAHVVGYVGRVSEADLAARERYVSTDLIGKNGLELVYESLLKGKNGRREVEVNALGEEQKIFAEVTPEPGDHLWLSLDADLQAVAEAALERSLGRAQSKRGAAIVLDPRSGAILSLVNLPTFDANRFNEGLSTVEYEALANDADHPLFNRVVQGTYPSGSTIKPIIAAAALAEGIVSPDTTFLSSGGIRIGAWFFPDWKAGGHGVTNVHKAIAESVNTFFYIVGGGYQGVVGLGMERLAHWASAFGLGQKTGVDLPHEATGFFPTPAWREEVKGEPWYIGDTYHVSIGQGDVLVTPLQVANYTAAFANGGTLYVPHLLSQVVDASGQVRSTVAPKVLKENVAPSDVIQVVREGMRQTVTAGSARSLSTLPLALAGKTGTAEPGGDVKTHAWFTGFGPYDKPELVVTVLVENSGDGSVFATPVAKEIFEWWAKNRLEQ